ncbi:hypothetical protein ACETK8_09560 [Brevundimonas staleyi]|uniref:Terminase n=1 Tax=Brevundimonas staleyi TaxID=74326 RepID=A0ABW0FP03_9CAUL
MEQTNPRPPRLTPEAWAAAREDFLAGAGAAVIAERYGTTERSIRRRAAMEGWRRPDFMPGPLGEAPPWMAEGRTKEEEIARDPALGEVDQAESFSRFGLLFNPSGGDLRRFAFRQAAENAAVDRPQQALAWMRLVQMVSNCNGPLESDSSAFRGIDHLRAAYLNRLTETFGELPSKPPANRPVRPEAKPAG